MADFLGTAGDDDFTGTSGDDNFNLHQGGEDTATGLGGNDIFSMGATLDAGDSLNGGTGSDAVFLRGDYSHRLTFGAGTITNIARLAVGAGFDYNLATNDATVASGGKMVIDASKLGEGDTLTFNGSAETNGHFHIFGGAGDDVVTGGNGGDGFDMRFAGGEDRFLGGGGDDLILGGANFDAGDEINGGGGAKNILRLDGDYSGGLTFAASTMHNIDVIQLHPGNDYDLTLAGSSLPANRLLIRGDHLGAGDTLTFDGEHAKGRLHMDSGAGDDTLTGGAFHDVLQGNLGADTMTGRGGADSFVYTAAAQSSLASMDHITDFDADQDNFVFPFQVTTVIAAQTTANTAADLSVSGLSAHGAAVVSVTGGLLASHTYLVVDGNGNAVFDVGDYVIDITGVKHIADLSTADFTT